MTTSKFQKTAFAFPFLLLSQNLYSAQPPTPSSQENVMDVEFIDGFFNGVAIDTKRYERGNPVVPGDYTVDVFFSNQEKSVAHINLRFIDANKNGIGIPCFTLQSMKRLGIKTAQWQEKFIDSILEQMPTAEKDDVITKECVPVTDFIPQFTWRFDNNEQKLFLSVPQSWLLENEDGDIDPSLWEQGINAGLLKYNMNAYSSKSNGGDTNNNAWLGLQGGINLGVWRLRYDANLNWDDTTGSDVTGGSLYIDRDLPAIQSTLRMGQSYSDSQLFDSFTVKGISLKSDERMLPMSQQGFAPSIRGVAETNAQITIRQNGNITYQTTVSPGPFEINTLRSIYSGRDIDVEIKEADGRIKTFTIPYTTSSDMLRPGVSRYYLTIGEYDNDDRMNKKPLVAQGTWQYGLSNLFTGYIGAQGTDDYGAGLLGVALNTNYGSLSVDVTHSQTTIDEDTYRGQSWKISYNKLLQPTNTNFQLAAYRYSTHGYFSLNDAMSYMYNDDYDDLSDIRRLKQRFQISMNQPLPDSYGSFYVSGSTQNYWDNASDSDMQYQLGYNNSLGSVTYSVSISRYFSETSNSDESQFFLNLSVPLGSLLHSNVGTNGSRPLFDMASMNYSQSSDKSSGLTSSISGSSHSDRNENYDVNYGLNLNYSNPGDSESEKLYGIGGYVNTNARYGQLSASISTDSADSRQASLSYSGGLIAHSGGITLSPEINLSAPMALVEAEGATDAYITNSNHAFINDSGYGVSSTLTPYRNNSVSLDTLSMTGDAELKNTAQEVVPYDGVLVKVNFASDIRKSVWFYVKRAGVGYGDAEEIPLGAEVYDDKENFVGTAGQNGLLITRGAPSSGTLLVKWGEKAQQSCRLTYTIPEHPELIANVPVIKDKVCQ